MPTQEELLELVDLPNETLAVEYKSWLDLDDNEARADLARHIAAVTNHGGGYIVFGFNDDLTVAAANPHPTPIDRDQISGIARRYLEPAPQCDVRLIRSTAGRDHPVIIVPPHGATPVCSRADGPHRNNRPVGITIGTYYLRKTGPRSDPIQNASEWAPLLRRCVMHERAALVAALQGALEGHEPQRNIADELKHWHEATDRRFLENVAKIEHPLNLGKSRQCLSYAIETPDGEIVPNLIDELNSINREVETFIRTGWSMFHIFYGPGLSPYWTTDPLIDEGEAEFLECSIVDQDTSFHSADFWRVSPIGRACLVREFWEDSLWARHNVQPGTFMSPGFLVRTIAEFVRHAGSLAKRFSSPTGIVFRCEWQGLEGRMVGDLSARWSPGHQPAKVSRLVSTGRWPIGAVESDWPSIVASLAGPMTRAFGVDRVVTPPWIEQLSPSWTR